MSRKRGKGKANVVLYEVGRRSLPEKIHHLAKIDDDSLRKNEQKKQNKKVQLHLTLDNDPDRYDDHWIGDEMLEKSQNMIRMWFQNCNGLVHNNDMKEFEYDVAMLADRGINYMSFSETCVNSSKPGFIRNLQDIFSYILPTGSIKLTNSPQYPKRSCYQPGGVAAGFDGVLRTRFLREGADVYGRWLWQEFGHGHMITRIYTLYRVNPGSEFSSGTRTAWFQQKILLEKAGLKNDPRSKVIEDIIADVKGCIVKGTNIILSGDFNEQIYSPEKLSQKLEEIGLFNVFEHRLETQTLPRTHARGTGAVDHIWVTKFLLDNIERAGMAPFGSVYESDHRGLYLDINADILFDKNETKIVFHDFRRLNTSIPKRVKKYRKQLIKTWNAHKITQKFDKLKSLFESSTDALVCEMEINKLDKQISEIMISAEKKCTSVSAHHLDYWSPELLKAMAAKRYWKSRVTSASKLPLKIGLLKGTQIYKDTLEKYREVEQIYLEKRKDAKNIREIFLYERAEEIALTRGTKAAQEVKSLIETEKEREKSARIKKTVKQKQNGGPSTVLIPAITEYQQPYPEGFDHYNIEHIWNRIEFDNGEDVQNWERVTDQTLVQSMLL